MSEIPTPSVPNPCSICGLPIYGSTIGTGDGTMRNGGSFAHPECYWQKRAETAERELAQARYETALKCAEMFPETMHESTLRIYLAIRAYAESVKPVAVASTSTAREGQS